jgi:hypothetical protein
MAAVGALVKGVPVANIEAIRAPYRGPVEAVAEDATYTGLLDDSYHYDGL